MERRTRERTTASRIKCLFLVLLEGEGPDAALHFLHRAGIQDDLITDETRPVPNELWYRALAEFEAMLGPEAIDDCAYAYLHHDNLAVWTAVLRGAETPSDAFRQLHQLGREQGTNAEGVSDWRTVSTTQDGWIGAAPLPPRAADVERVTRARQAELRTLVSLFGYRVVILRTRHEAAEGVTYFEVRWARPWTWVRLGAALTGAAAGTLLGASVEAAGHPGIGFTVGGLLGFACGAAGWHDAQRRARATCQSFRIQALERSGSLTSRRDAAGAPFESGTVLGGQFRLRRPIGVGAAGAVWEAERLADGSLVALKLLRTAVAHDSQAADRLRREADALGLAWHPNVVEVLDHGHLPSGIAYIVMELLVGESLDQRLERQQRLDTEELREIALQACDALDAVHAAGVVHRDIKPSNLFLTRDSAGNLRLKLVDFGVAQVAWAETRLTRSGTPLGTPGYMAPEQEAGRVVDGRSDLFSLGGVLYEALAGRPPPVPPVTGDTGPPVPWIDLTVVPPDWREILQRLLAPWPNQRFPDARALRKALRALEHDGAGSHLDSA